ncbi:hypothetical protein PLESTF_000894400 [Pleodorina starrii]|nr:hypothetical protein PLESTM_002049600 [Pleodorina starrii]GLC69907.1 hypothetical protein PLESTF_000894400 [Pleodorina starrii]
MRRSTTTTRWPGGGGGLGCLPSATNMGQSASQLSTSGCDCRCGHGSRMRPPAARVPPGASVGRSVGASAASTASTGGLQALEIRCLDMVFGSAMLLLKGHESKPEASLRRRITDFVRKLVRMQTLQALSCRLCEVTQVTVSFERAQQPRHGGSRLSESWLMAILPAGQFVVGLAYQMEDIQDWRLVGDVTHALHDSGIL